MTVVAWDGRTLAADKRSTCAGLACTTTKLRRIGHQVIAWTGDQDSGEMLSRWYTAGAVAADWPKCQEDKDTWSRLIVADADGAHFYERQPVAIRVEDPFMAWGSGRDFAIAAMHLGKSAREAVEVASRFEICCGNGVDAVDLRA